MLALGLLLCALEANAQIMTTVAGGGVDDHGEATAATVCTPDNVAVHPH